MADTVHTKWIHPPNWDGNPPGYQFAGWSYVIIQLTGLSDGTGETDVQKLDISELRMSKGEIPTRTVVEVLNYNVSGLNVLLEWDRAPHAEICRILGEAGAVSGKNLGPFTDPSDGVGDGTGDILLTTTGYITGDGYDITLKVRLK